MSQAIVYYSFGGATAKYAAEEAKRLGIDVFEIKEAKKRTIFGAFLKGCPMAMKQAPSKLANDLPDLSKYDKIIIACPIWAAFPAPAFNAILEIIPKGKDVEIRLTSGSGQTGKSHDLIVEKVKSCGLNLTDYTDVKTSQNR